MAAVPLRIPRFGARSSRPSFFWQGALILLPAVALCAMGLYSLRQDRVFAEHQATERARNITRDASQRLLQLITPAPAPSETTLDQFLRDGPATPAEDPLLQAAQAALPHVVVLLNETGQLLYPPAIQPLPPPDPFDAAELNPDQADAWNHLEAEFRRDGSDAQIAPPLNDFLSVHPPDRFDALARYRAALACRRRGLTDDALALLQSVTGVDLALRTESGLPLRDFVELQLLDFISPALRKETMDRLCRRQVANPTEMTPKILEHVKAVEDTEAWSQVWNAHQAARSLAESLGPNLNAEHALMHDGKRYFMISQAIGAGRLIHVIPESKLVAAASRIADSSSLPAFFGFAATLDGVPLKAAPGLHDGDIFAAKTVDVPGSEHPVSLTVQVYLDDARGFYREQQLRTLRLGSLIALSALAVLIGFFAAKRAFQRQQQLSEMKTNFVSSVSHELRAPIASVRLMAEELQLGSAPSAEKLRDYLRFIVVECRRLSAVIENVLDFSRREQGRERFEFEPTDVARLIEETVHLMQTYGAEKEIHIDTIGLDSPAESELDGRAFQRLLVNLLDNAIKHSPPKGRVTAGLECTENRVRVWVEDHGPGIPKEEHARIFERFYRIGSELRRETQGVGLGLSIVKHIAEVHGGVVHVRSDVGRGSRFTVELPATRSAHAAIHRSREVTRGSQLPPRSREESK